MKTLKVHIQNLFPRSIKIVLRLNVVLTCAGITKGVILLWSVRWRFRRKQSYSVRIISSSNRIKFLTTVVAQHSENMYYHF